jgi:hypothetical protein
MRAPRGRCVPSPRRTRRFSASAPLWIIEDPKATCKQSKELCEESEKLCDKAKIVRAESGEVVEQAPQTIIGSRLRRNTRTVIMK